MNQATNIDDNNQYVPPDLVSTTATNTNGSQDQTTVLSLQQHAPTDNESTPTSHTAATDATRTPLEQEESSNQTGGRLWKLAGEEVQQVGPTTNNNNKWAETFKARTRSCADPNAIASNNSTTTDLHTTPPPPSDVVSVMVPNDQLVYPDRDVLPVAQLLILGMVGILVGWLGNAVVGTSCYFASVNVSTGQKEVELHFGLYKYSTVESGLNGYEYCVPYSGSYANQAPIVARTMNILALFFGTLSLIVIWWTLVVGSSLVRPWIWKWSTRAAVLAGLCQLSTLSFYVETICRQNGCHVGPASYLNGIASVVWFGIAREMRLRSPAWMVEESHANCESETSHNKAGLELPEQTRASLYEPPGINC